MYKFTSQMATGLRLGVKELTSGSMAGAARHGGLTRWRRPEAEDAPRRWRRPQRQLPRIATRVLLRRGLRLGCERWPGTATAGSATRHRMPEMLGNGDRST